MSFSKRLQDAFRRAFTDETASTELLDVLGSSAGAVVAAGEFTTAGGDASETITAADVIATDIALVTLRTAGAVPRTILSANSGAGSIAVTMSGDPSTDHVLSYIVVRLG